MRNLYKALDSIVLKVPGAHRWAVDLEGFVEQVVVALYISMFFMGLFCHPICDPIDFWGLAPFTAFS